MRQFVIGSLALTATFIVAISTSKAQEDRPAVPAVVKPAVVERGTVIKGRVVRVEPAENVLVIRTAEGKERTLAFTETTRLRLDNRAARIVDLRQGMDIAVAYEGVNGREIITEVTSPVVVAEPEERTIVRWRGRVLKVLADSSRIIVRDADGKRLTLHADANTIIRVGDRETRLGNLTEGMDVVLQYEMRPVLTSIRTEAVVITDAPAAVTARGTILRVEEPKNLVVVRTADGKELQLTLNPDTVLKLNNRAAKIVDLRAETQVTVAYDVRDGQYVVRTLEGPVTVVTLKAPLAGSGHIYGVILEGDRPQPEIEVVLYDEFGKAVAQKKTAVDGTFVFENMALGKYTVRSQKPLSKTVGEKGITVEDGKAHEVKVELFRAATP